MAGIALGVAALIVVLSVMNGFQKEVRDRMLSVIAHVEIFDTTGSGLDRWQTLAEAESSRVLAANQGLYNGFLVAGLIWGLLLGADGLDVKVFFLSCVVVAGVYGALTVGRKILFVQALPAAVALLALCLAQG